MDQQIDSRQAADLLAGQDRILILTHKRPDGDTIGCAAGLCHALRQIGKTAWVHPNPDATPLLAGYLDGLLLPEGEEPAFIVSVDVASRQLFGPELLAWVERGVDLAIDHHPSYEGFGIRSCVDPGRAACGELVLEIVEMFGPVTPEIARPLYAAVATDTGCFVYSNTTAATHRAAARLMETGIDYRALNKIHFRTKSWKRMQIESRLIQDIDLRDDGTIAFVCVTRALMEQLGADQSDITDISSLAGQLEGVKNAITIREEPDACKVSIRSSGGLNASRVCTLLGGGGHAAAAGCELAGYSVAQAKQAVMDAIRQVERNG